MKTKVKYLLTCDYASPGPHNKTNASGIFTTIYKEKKSEEIVNFYVAGLFSEISKKDSPEIIKIDLIGPDKKVVATATLKKSEPEPKGKEGINFLCAFNFPVFETGTYGINIYFDGVFEYGEEDFFDVELNKK